MPVVDTIADPYSILIQDSSMIRWNNDYNHGAHPAILSALQNTNGQSYGGYGLDEWCEKAAALIKAQLGGADADVHFLLGGTQANFTVINAALRPYQGVISTESGHIHAHETGAVEHGGHKIHVLKGVDGKLTAEAVAAEAQAFLDSGVKEHITQPKLVYISFPTEFGTVYSKQELEALADVCRRYCLYLFVDGARMGYGLAADGGDVTLADIARCADAFYIGGTKCGALMGEAVVLVNDDLKENFRSYIKQNGGMLAKGWLLGLQFATLFEGGLYFSITKKAVQDAMRIRDAFREHGIPFHMESPTNQQFVVLDEGQMKALGAKHIFEYIVPAGEGRHCVRFCTSWSTHPEDVEELTRDIAVL